MHTQAPTMRSARDTICRPSGAIQLCFLRTTTDTLGRLLAAEQDDLRRLKQECSLLENASLCIHRHGTNYYFASRAAGTKKEQGISTDLHRIHGLARRHFLRNRIRAIENSCQQLASLMELHRSQQQELALRDQLSRYQAAGLDLTRILFSKEQNAWIDAPYTPNPFHPENLTHPTTHGFLMRSKSEAAIGSFLESLGLPYRYDDLVTLEHGRGPDRPARDSYFADFKVPNLIGGITIHEHLGAFQLEHYAGNAMQRLNDYHNFPLVELPGQPAKPQEITFSLESDLRTSSLMQRLVWRMLLPDQN